MYNKEKKFLNKFKDVNENNIMILIRHKLGLLHLNITKYK